MPQRVRKYSDVYITKNLDLVYLVHLSIRKRQPNKVVVGRSYINASQKKTFKWPTINKKLLNSIILQGNADQHHSEMLLIYVQND